MNTARTIKFGVFSHKFDDSRNLYLSDKLFTEINENNIENINKPLWL